MRCLAFSVSLPAQPILRLKRPVEGLLLDNCNILYDATGWRRWLLQVLRRLGLHSHYACLFHVWEKDYLPPVHRGECNPCEAVRLFLRALGLSRGQVEEVATTCQTRRCRWEAETRLLPGVRSTLKQLASEGIPLAVVANSEHSGFALRERLERMGLPGVFSAVVTSSELDAVKPEPICYQTALDALDLHACQAAFLGHDADELAGAARLGMQTIAFNPTHEVDADVLLTRFKDLLELLALAHRPSCRNMAG